MKFLVFINGRKTFNFDETADISLNGGIPDFIRFFLPDFVDGMMVSVASAEKE